VVEEKRLSLVAVGRVTLRVARLGVVTPSAVLVAVAGTPFPFHVPSPVSSTIYYLECNRYAIIPSPSVIDHVFFLLLLRYADPPHGALSAVLLGCGIDKTRYGIFL
jgi:hypothetical protein